MRTYCEKSDHRVDPDWNDTADGCPYCRIEALLAEVEKLKGYNRKLCEGAESENQRALLAESKLSRSETEVERLKQCVDTHWAWDEIRKLEAKLSRYEQGVEVEGIINIDSNAEENAGVIVIHTPFKDIGQRVRVLVMKEEG